MNSKKIIFLDGDESSLINMKEGIEINGKRFSFIESFKMENTKSDGGIKITMSSIRIALKKALMNIKYKEPLEKAVLQYASCILSKSEIEELIRKWNLTYNYEEIQHGSNMANSNYIFSLEFARRDVLILYGYSLKDEDPLPPSIQLLII